MALFFDFLSYTNITNFRLFFKLKVQQKEHFLEYHKRRHPEGCLVYLNCEMKHALISDANIAVVHRIEMVGEKISIETFHSSLFFREKGFPFFCCRKNKGVQL